ncbi:MAG TPA: phosphoribosylpyrophosphate synthetase [Cyclobacteriaceae bacterium]|jgi:hypothetical protein
MRTYETLSDALVDLKKRGYNIDFRKDPKWIYCYVYDLWFTPEEFNVDEFYRFEENSDPADNAIVYAISSYSGMKGTLIDSYGVYAEYMTFEMAQKFEVNYL